MSTFTNFSPPSGRYLLKNATILTMDSKLGCLEKADLLIDGKYIIEVGHNLHCLEPLNEIDVSGCIILPGFIDTHHHQHETSMRGLLANGLLLNDKKPDSDFNYFDVILNNLTSKMRPWDVYHAILVSSLSQLDAGVTTVVDVSQVCHTPDHSDALVKALQDSGRRSILAYSLTESNTQDLYRLNDRYFASHDQLLSLALTAELTSGFRTNWELARSMNLPIVTHIVGLFGHSRILQEIRSEQLLSRDNILVHCTGLSDEDWSYIADSGSKISLSVPIELTMRHGTSPILQALNHGIEPSLSSDVECTMSADFFTQMRTTFILQRGLINDCVLKGKVAPCPLIECMDVIRYATIEGAKAMNLDHKIGSITPGKEADVIILRADTLNTMPLNNAAGAIVTLMDRSNVDTVIVAGKVLKWRGKMLNLNERKLLTNIQASRDFLFEVGNIKKGAVANRE